MYFFVDVFISGYFRTTLIWNRNRS